MDEESITETDIALGQRVRDEVTGFEGVVVVQTYFLYNCPQVCVQPTGGTDVTEVGDSEWFDTPRVSVLDEGVSEEYGDLAVATESETGSVGASCHQKQNRR